MVQTVGLGRGERGQPAEPRLQREHTGASGNRRGGTPLLRGLGLEAAGTVDALGEGVTGVQIGDRVFGPAAFDGPTAGAAEYALMPAWARVPEDVAAALPMAAETAWRALDDLGVQPGELLLVHGAGATVGGHLTMKRRLLPGGRRSQEAGLRRSGGWHENAPPWAYVTTAGALKSAGLARPYRTPPRRRPVPGGGRPAHAEECGR